MEDLKKSDEGEKVPRFFCGYVFQNWRKVINNKLKQKTDVSMGYNWQKEMKTKSIIIAIVAIMFVGLSSFTMKDNKQIVNGKDDNPISISSQSVSGDGVPIRWGGKTLGTLEWSIVKYVSTDRGGIMVLSLYNNSSKYIRVSITGKNANRCYSGGWELRPQQRNDEVTFDCSERVSDFEFLITVDD